MPDALAVTLERVYVQLPQAKPATPVILERTYLGSKKDHRFRSEGVRSEPGWRVWPAVAVFRAEPVSRDHDTDRRLLC
jgi:hypothetical protein